MVYIPRMPSDQRMALSRATGAAELWAIGRYRDRPRDEAVAALHEITRDPFVLGVGMGLALADDHPAVVELYRAAGADEAAAAEHEADLRAARARLGVSR
jgi:hypothetical protein